MTRRALDFYETPAWQTHALVARLNIANRMTVLECCSGDGSLARVLASYVGPIETNDIDPAREAYMHGDATDPAWWASLPTKHDAVITNPPFNVAHKILPLAIAHARSLVVMLGRMSWLEPTKEREALWVASPPDGLIVLPRCSYTANGKTDSVTTAWYVWACFPPADAPVPCIQVVPRSEKR
jgi:hypothetical protein